MDWVIFSLLIILAIALVIVFKNREQNEEKAKLAITGIVAAIVVLIGIQLFFGGRSPTPTAGGYDPANDEALGEEFARRIVDRMQGERILLVADIRPHQQVGYARLQGAKRAFEAEGKEILAKVDGTVLERNGERLFAEEGLLPEALTEALREYSEADTLVSLVGFPPMNNAELLAALRGVEFFVVEAFPWLDWYPYLADGTVDGLILSPPDADWRDDSGTPAELYERRYLMVTGQNFRDVYARFEYGY